MEQLQQKINNLEFELKDIKQRNDQLLRVSKRVTTELAEVKENDIKYRNNLAHLKKEADEAKKERNVLAHQSSLLLQGITLDNDKMMLIQEIEQLKRNLEDNTNNYESKIAELQV